MNLMKLTIPFGFWAICLTVFVTNNALAGNGVKNISQVIEFRTNQIGYHHENGTDAPRCPTVLVGNSTIEAKGASLEELNQDIESLRKLIRAQSANVPDNDTLFRQITHFLDSLGAIDESTASEALRVSHTLYLLIDETIRYIEDQRDTSHVERFLQLYDRSRDLQFSLKSFLERREPMGPSHDGHTIEITNLEVISLRSGQNSVQPQQTQPLCRLKSTPIGASPTAVPTTTCIQSLGEFSQFIITKVIASLIERSPTTFTMQVQGKTQQLSFTITAIVDSSDTDAPSSLKIFITYDSQAGDFIDWNRMIPGLSVLKNRLQGVADDLITSDPRDGEALLAPNKGKGLLYYRYKGSPFSHPLKLWGLIGQF